MCGDSREVVCLCCYGRLIMRNGVWTCVSYVYIFKKIWFKLYIFELL